jgi:guanylate kinase
MKREAKQEKPAYAEMCRRFLADEKDFSEEVLRNLGINKKFINDDFDTCVQEIVAYIESESRN